MTDGSTLLAPSGDKKNTPKTARKRGCKNAENPAFLHPVRAPKSAHQSGAIKPKTGGAIEAKSDTGEVVAQQTRNKRRKVQPGASLQREALVQGLKAMVPALHRIAAEGRELGLEAPLHAHLLPGIENQARQLEALT